MSDTTVYSSQTFDPPLTDNESLAISDAIERVRRNPHRTPEIQARTAISLLLGKSKSKRRQQLVRAALEGAGAVR